MLSFLAHSSLGVKLTEYATAQQQLRKDEEAFAAEMERLNTTLFKSQKIEELPSLMAKGGTKDMLDLYSSISQLKGRVPQTMQPQLDKLIADFQSWAARRFYVSARASFTVVIQARLAQDSLTKLVASGAA